MNKPLGEMDTCQMIQSQFTAEAIFAINDPA